MNLQVKFKGDVYYFNMGVRHVRNYKELRDKNGKVTGRVANIKGGMTIISTVPVGEESTIPRIYPSRCHEKDNFNKRMGVIYSVQDLIWDLLSVNCVMSNISFTNNGNTMQVDTVFEQEDPVGEFNYNLKSLCKHNALAVS
jgi:hypothetical protein